MSFFLNFLKTEGVIHPEGVSRKHLEALLEHQHDRRMKPVSIGVSLFRRKRDKQIWLDTEIIF